MEKRKNKWVLSIFNIKGVRNPIETQQRQDIQTQENKGMENQIIQLFRDGLIGKDDLMKLLTSQKKKTEANNYIH